MKVVQTLSGYDYSVNVNDQTVEISDSYGCMSYNPITHVVTSDIKIQFSVSEFLQVQNILGDARAIRLTVEFIDEV